LLCIFPYAQFPFSDGKTSTGRIIVFCNNFCFSVGAYAHCLLTVYGRGIRTYQRLPLHTSIFLLPFSIQIQFNDLFTSFTLQMIRRTRSHTHMNNKILNLKKKITNRRTRNTVSTVSPGQSPTITLSSSKWLINCSVIVRCYQYQSINYPVLSCFPSNSVTQPLMLPRPSDLCNI
jgi:hypothetical protein